MVEAGRDPKGRETKVRRWMHDRDSTRTIFFLYIGNWSCFILFVFLLVWIIFFCFCCLICVDFFVILFFCYTLPCFSLILGVGLALSFALLFIVICCLFFNHFPSWIFCCFFLFVGLIALGTSSFRLVMSLWRLVAQRLRFEDGYRRIVSYTIDDLGKRVAWLTRINEHGTLKKRLTMGWEEDAWTRGGVRLLPPGWSWLDDVGDGVNCFVFFCFFNLLKIHGDCWQGAGMKKRFLAQLLLGWGWIPQCFPKLYSCYDTDPTAEITDAPTS